LIKKLENGGLDFGCTENGYGRVRKEDGARIKELMNYESGMELLMMNLRNMLFKGVDGRDDGYDELRTPKWIDDLDKCWECARHYILWMIVC